ncbi:MAG: deoxyribonuclease HsdR, partial [Verrucomicrobiales bacterium]|nr:deoxyribonuclease HsdR [Verrucomicrobiales bacterium]
MRRKAKEKAKLKLGQEQRVQFASDRPNSVVESNETSGSVWARFQCLLSAPVSGKSLAVLRICFGAIMFLEAVSLVRPSAMTMGHTPLENYYAGPGIRFNFPFEGFEWLPFLSVQGFRVMVGILGFAGLMVAFGVFYRISAAILFLTWGYFFSVESTRTYWQSYYYLEML